MLLIIENEYEIIVDSVTAVVVASVHKHTCAYNKMCVCITTDDKWSKSYRSLVSISISNA